MTDTLELDVSAKDKALSDFKRGDVALMELVKKHTGKKVNGIEDRAGLKAVHEGRMELAKARVSIDKTRKELKAVALEYGRAVDKEAARLTAIIEPLETDLDQQERAIEAEKDRIKAAEEAARRARIQVRLDAFRALGVTAPLDVDTMTEADYQASYAAAKLIQAQREAEKAAEAKRLADEAEARRLERVELDRQKAEQAKVAQEQAEALQRIKDAEAKIEAEKVAQRRAAELEEAKAQAAERARIDTEARLKREADEEKHMNEEAARIEAERVARDEAAKKKAKDEAPVWDRIISIAAQVEGINILPMPPVLYDRIAKILTKASKDIQKLANGPLDE